MVKKWPVVAIVVTLISAALTASPAEAKSDDALDAVSQVFAERPELVEPQGAPVEVVVSGGEVSAAKEMGEHEISLQRTVRGARRTGVDGSRSAISDGDNTVVVEGLTDGFRIMEVIDDRKAGHKFIYRVSIDDNKARFAQDSDGSVLVGIGNPSKGIFEPVATIEAPWAFDKNGNPVGVSFNVSKNGSQLTMKVDRAASGLYPIVADPKLKTHWWGQTIKLNRTELDNVRGALIGGGGVFAIAAAACAGATGGLCAIPWALGIGIMAIGSGALLLCANSKGVDIHRSWAGGIWCSGY